MEKCCVSNIYFIKRDEDDEREVRPQKSIHNHDEMVKGKKRERKKVVDMNVNFVICI